MTVGSFLSRLVSLLDEAGIPHMLTGSMASAFYGEPRSTRDIDLIIQPRPRSLRAFLGSLDADDYYVSETAALDALRRRGQFNIIDLETGWKVDLIVCKDRPFSRTELERRQRRQILGLELAVCSPEDCVLSKLEWAARSGGSERQLRDVAGVVHGLQDRLDLDYISYWADELGVAELWAQVNEDTD